MMGQHLAHSLGAFRGQVTDSFVPLEVSRSRRESGTAFAASLSSIAADGVAFTEVQAAAHTVERTDATIAAGGSGYFKMSLMTAGSAHLSQGGREATLHPGDLTMYDTSRPYSLSFDEEFRSLIVMFPKDRLELPTTLTEQLAAVALPHADGGLAPVVASYLSQLPAQLARVSSGVRTRLAHTSLDLITTLCADVLGAAATPGDPREELMQRIYAHIEERLGSTALSPGSIAAAHFISKRHLHVLFREAGTTVSQWIRERRLAHAHSDLLAPVRSPRTVAAIAARWGFSDAAHFSRVFKASFGLSPSAARAEHAAQPPTSSSWQ